MFFSIPRCYDSHLHLLATGMVCEELSLVNLKSAEDVGNLKIEKHHYRGDWLTGFGWDQYNWKGSTLPTKQLLDKYFPNTPVYFTRIDGHAAWVNTKALQLASVNQGFGDAQSSSGVLIDLEMQKVQKLIPQYGSQGKLHFLKSATRKMNENGFTHIRDMSGDEEQWTLLTKMDELGDLTLYVEENFTCDKKENFEHVLRLAQYAKKNETAHLKVSGIKVYYDGALGSEGALLSQHYQGSEKVGLKIWADDDLKEIIKRSWEQNLQISIHAIGDEAAHQVAKIAYSVWGKGLHGRLNIEHGEVIRSETIQLLAAMNVHVFMQPCHWLSDRRWLKEKLGSLYENAFPWGQLQKAGVPLHWGSDTPIEPASVFNNLRALQESVKAGIPEYKGNLLLPHTYPDKIWGPSCQSDFRQTEDELKVLKVVFDGKNIIN